MHIYGFLPTNFSILGAVFCGCPFGKANPAFQVDSHLLGCEEFTFVSCLSRAFLSFLWFLQSVRNSQRSAHGGALLCRLSSISSRSTWISDLRAVIWSLPLIGLYSILCRVSRGCLPKTWQDKGITEGAELKKWIFNFFFLLVAGVTKWLK